METSGWNLSSLNDLVPIFCHGGTMKLLLINLASTWFALKSGGYRLYSGLIVQSKEKLTYIHVPYLHHLPTSAFLSCGRCHHCLPYSTAPVLELLSEFREPFDYKSKVSNIVQL